MATLMCSLIAPDTADLSVLFSTIGRSVTVTERAGLDYTVSQCRYWL